MAQTLEEFNFGRLRSSGGSHYDQFMDGQIWKLTEDDSPSGTASLRSMQSNMSAVARSRDLRLRSNIVVEGKKEFLVIQAYNEEEE